jgi:protein O-mannosyl-transferase
MDPETQFRSPAAPANQRIIRAAILAILLAVVTLAVYSPVSYYDFADLDDAAYVTENLHIKYGLDWDAVKWAFTTSYQDWHPLTWLSHGLDCELFRLDPGRHHDMNVLLHGLNVLLLFWVLLKATGYVGRSAMVAALFALHPINVESVVWIAERKNVLSMSFFLLALGAWHWYAMKPGVGRYLLVAFLFALGLMSKSQVITLPFVLLLWDYWPLRRWSAGAREVPAGMAPTDSAIPPRQLSWLLLEKLPLLALCAASAMLTLHAQRAGGAINPLNSYLLSIRVQNAIVSYGRYLGKALWPAHLAAFYPYQRTGFNMWLVVASCLLLIIVTGLVLICRRRRYLAVGWLWFLGTLVPMIGLVHVGDHSMADRYSYLPFVGLFIMFVWGISDLASGKIRRTDMRPGWLAAFGIAILVILMLLTHRQIGYWKNNVTLWSHAAAVTKDNDTAETFLGQALLRRDNPQAAIPHFQRAIAIFPEGPRAHMFLGVAEQQSGNPRAALEQFQTALDLDQKYGTVGAWIRAATLQGMAYAYRDLGDFPRAEQSLDAAQQASQVGASPLP